MGEVYLAQDTRLRRLVALKLLPANFTADEDRLNRFEREAYTASSLNHPDILTIYEIGEENVFHFIATEFIEGESLRQRMDRKPLELREVLDIGVQVASALSAAHAAGIVHRDIKPENIMVRHDGIAKVLDFGIAKLIGQASPAPDKEVTTRDFVGTDPGAVVGTASYMSPEQARGLQVDERADIWSLGVVLYEMITGHLPFEGETTRDVTAAILKIEPPLLTNYAPDAPAELERIVTKTLRKDREERYQVIKELGLDLKSLKQHLEFKAELDRTESPSRNERAATNYAGVAAQTDENSSPQVTHATSSVEYIVSEVKNHKLAAFVMMFMLAVAFAGYFVFSSSRPEAITSVAVLPFENGSGDPNLDYLSDGLSESVIDRLSQLPQLKVIARSSAFKYKNKEIDPQEVARALGVGAVVTGRVVQRGDKLTVRAELVDARENKQMWGEQFNRGTGDALAVQEEIAQAISEKLQLKLTGVQEQRLTRRDTANPEAYELLLKGRFYSRKGGVENRKKAVEYYRKAIAADANYALAYAELCLSYNNLIAQSILDPKEFTPKAEAAARKALELDENLADAHYALAYLKTDMWEWAAAEREFKRALELNPNLARTGYAYYLNFVGRHDQAITEIKRIRELDPLSPPVNAVVGYTFYFARQYDQAIEVLKKTLELDHNYDFAYLYIGYSYAAKGTYAEAVNAYREAIKLGGDTPSRQIFLGAAYARAGEQARARDILKRLQTSKDYVSPGELAILYAALNEREQAFASLECAYSAHDLQLQFLRVDPAFDSLRDDPRFADLLRRIGLAS